MSTSIKSNGATIHIGEPCSVNGKATVSAEVVMSDEEREEMIQRLVDESVGEESRAGVLDVLRLVVAEGES